MKKFKGILHGLYPEAEDMTIEQYIVGYAWVANLKGFGDTPTPDQIHCAWCKKSQSKIAKTEDLDEHIQSHLEDERDLEAKLK